MAEIDTRLTTSIKLSDQKKMYDEVCKNFLSNKPILAYIMKNCLSEYKDVEVQDIADFYIEHEPHIGSVAVLDGESIDGLPTEDIGLNEGKIFYDIRYRATAPSNDEEIELIINVEAQNQYNPGYPLVKRGIYYDCRMISGQYGTDFDKMDYNKIKKVYSIWICRNVPKGLENSITSYDIRETNIIGAIKEHKRNYDLMSVVMVYLGEATDASESDVLSLLNCLLSEELRAKEKLKILSEEYNIQATKRIESEVTQMCNLSQGIEDKAMERGKDIGRTEGINLGIERGIIQTAKNLLSMGLSIDQIMKGTGLSKQEVEQLT